MRKQMSPELESLLAETKARVAAMTPEERVAEYAAQRQSWLRGEIGMGNDADEAAWRAANMKRLEADPKPTHYVVNSGGPGARHH